MGPAPLARPLDVYRDLGMVVGGPDFRGVGRFASFAGPADSTFLLFALSFPPEALRFHRDEAGFTGEYRVALTAVRGGQRQRRLELTETVRVAERRETMRSDEAVFLQAFLALEPGEYEIQVHVQDMGSPRGMNAVDTLRLPAYGAEGVRFSGPVLVNEAGGRDDPGALPQLLANPRSTVPYADEPALVYLEAYGSLEGAAGVLEVRDAGGSEVWRTEVAFGGGNAGVRVAVVTVPVQSLPIGRLELAFLSPGETTPVATAPVLVTLADTWIVADFSEVLDYLSLIAEPEEIERLRAATGLQRARLWEEFWAARDPDPTTTRNEYRDAYFERVRESNLRFREPGMPGWRTDRGMVFIVLGPPITVQEQPGDVGGQPRVIVWIYQDATLGRAELRFIDDTGFGRYRMTPSSRADFNTLAERIRRRRTS
ncbi:MAG: GWxTD domain-containing protein [Gemmatimonadetes bacterium]|nr:GWxTD domain-containing protein [Gemmatimonadota bacterium]